MAGVSLGITIKVTDKNNAGKLFKTLSDALKRIDNIKMKGLTKAFKTLRKEQEKTAKHIIKAEAQINAMKTRTHKHETQLQTRMSKSKKKLLSEDIRSMQSGLRQRMKLIEKEEKARKDADKRAQDRRDKANAHMMGTANLFVRASTGMFAALENFGLPRGISLTSRALSDVARSMITLGKGKGTLSGWQGMYRALGRMAEGFSKTFVNIWLGMLKMLLKLATTVLTKILHVFKRVFQGISIALGAFIAKSIIDFAKFQQKIAEATVLIPKFTSETFTKLYKGVRGIIKELPTSFEEATAALVEIVSTGIEEETKAINFLKSASELATATATTTAVTTKALLTITSAYGKEAGNIEKIQGVLFRTVDKSRASMEQLSHEMGFFIGVARNANIALEEVFATFSLITRVMGVERAGRATSRLIESITVPTEQAKELMKSLDVSPFEIGEYGQEIFIGMEKFLIKLAQKNYGAQFIGNLFPNVIARRGALAILSQFYNKVEDASGNMVDGVTKMFADLNESTTAMVKPLELMSETISNVAKMAWNNLKIFGEALINQISQPLTEALHKVKDFLIKLDDTFHLYIDSGGFATFVDRMNNMVGNIDLSIGTAKLLNFFNTIDKIFNKTLDILEKIPRKLAEAHQWVKKNSQTIFGDYIPQVLDGFTMVAGLIVEMSRLSVKALSPLIKFVGSAINLYKQLDSMIGSIGGIKTLDQYSSAVKRRKEVLKEIEEVQEKITEKKIAADAAAADAAAFEDALLTERLLTGLSLDTLRKRKKADGSIPGLPVIPKSLDERSMSNLKKLKASLSKELGKLNEQIAKVSKPKGFVKLDLLTGGIEELDKFALALEKKIEAFGDFLKDLSVEAGRDMVEGMGQGIEEGSSDAVQHLLAAAVQHLGAAAVQHLGAAGKLLETAVEDIRMKVTEKQKKAYMNDPSGTPSDIRPAVAHAILVDEGLKFVSADDKKIISGHVKALQEVLLSEVERQQLFIKEGLPTEALRNYTDEIRNTLVSLFGASSNEVERFNRLMLMNNVVTKDYAVMLRGLGLTQEGYVSTLKQIIQLEAEKMEAMVQGDEKAKDSLERWKSRQLSKEQAAGARVRAELATGPQEAIQATFSAKITEEYEDRWVNVAQTIEGAFDNTFSTLKSSIATFLQEGEFSFQKFSQTVRGIFINMLVDIGAELLKRKFMHMLMGAGINLAGMFAGAGGAPSPGTSPSGRLMAPDIPLNAKGGIIKSPTLGWVGEGRYNEAIIPLPDNKSVPVKLFKDTPTEPVSEAPVNVNIVLDGDVIMSSLIKRKNKFFNMMNEEAYNRKRG